MAISYSYSIAEPDSSSMLLGTMIDDVTSRITTKSFLIGDIFDLFELSLAFSSLTTTGTTGAATLVGGVLNIPQYSGTPYKMYTVLLTQSGGTDPAKTVLYNNVSGTIEFARTATGTYTCTITGVDTFTSAWYAITDNRFSLGINQNYMVINKTASNVITIYTYKAGALSDGLLLDTPLEIKIF
jgi:hypothetical protein